MGAEQSKGKTTNERVPEEPVEYVDPVVKEQKLKEVCKNFTSNSTLV
jgi:hypothetical protein